MKLGCNMIHLHSRHNCKLHGTQQETYRKQTPPTIERPWRDGVMLLTVSRCKWKGSWQCLQSPDLSTQEAQSCTESLVFCALVFCGVV